MHAALVTSLRALFTAGMRQATSTDTTTMVTNNSLAVNAWRRRDLTERLSSKMKGEHRMTIERGILFPCVAPDLSLTVKTAHPRQFRLP